MSTFHLIMLRPDKTFFDGEVVSVDVGLPDGRETLLRGHMPMLFNLTTAMAKLVFEDKSEKLFAHGEGILTVYPDKAILQSDFLAWEERMAAAIERREKAMEQEKLRRKQSYMEYKLNKLEMAKTFINLEKHH